MTGRQWRRTAVLVIVLAALILVPPSIRISGTNDIAWCRPLGIEWRDPVSLSTSLTPSQADAVQRYVEQGGLADAAEATEHITAACDDARQDRQTLVVIAVGFVLGVLIVRRNRLESASRPTAAELAPAPSGEDDQ